MTGRQRKIGIPTFLVALLVGTTLIVGCSGKSGEAGAPTTKQYAENGISFNYPGTWVITSPSSQYAIVMLTDPQAKTVSITVEKRTMPSGYTLKTFNDELVIGIKPSHVLSGTFPTIAGAPACETVFRANDSQVRIVNLEKDDNMYTILCSAPAATFSNAQTSFNMVINSFKVQ